MQQIKKSRKSYISLKSRATFFRTPCMLTVLLTEEKKRSLWKYLVKKLQCIEGIPYTER